MVMFGSCQTHSANCKSEELLLVTSPCTGFLKAAAVEVGIHSSSMHVCKVGDHNQEVPFT